MITQEKLLEKFYQAIFRAEFQTGVIHKTSVQTMDYNDGLLAISNISNNINHPKTGRLVTATSHLFRIDNKLDEILQFLPPGAMQGRLLLGAKVIAKGHEIVWAEQIPDTYQLITKQGQLITENNQLIVISDTIFFAKQEDAEKTGCDRILDRFMNYQLKIEDFKKSAIIWFTEMEFPKTFSFQYLVEKLVCNKNYGAASAFRQSLRIMRKYET